MNTSKYTAKKMKITKTNDSPHLMLVNNVQKRRKKKAHSTLLKSVSLRKLISGGVILLTLFAVAGYYWYSTSYAYTSLDIPLSASGAIVNDYLLSYATLTFDGKGSGDAAAIAGAGKLMPVVKTLSYVIKPGDTLSGIAKTYHLDVGTLISFNKIPDVRRVMAGTTLKIPDIDGVPYTIKRGDTLEKIAQQYKVPLNSILDANDLASAILQPGESIFIPGARISTYEYKKATGTLFIYPTRGRLTSPFGMRIDPFTGTRRMHYGIDLANRVGTPVRATMAGVVVVIANHPQGYGNFIVIQHARGFQSLYGHLSAILVHKGQRVTQGQKIGLMGTTGRSTGPHLHFSIYKNHVPVNPLGGYLYR